MEKLLILLIGVINLGCQGQDIPDVFLKLDMSKRQVSVQLPTSTKTYNWPYYTVALPTNGGKDEWPSGMALETSKVSPSPGVQFRFFSTQSSSVRMEATFVGAEPVGFGVLNILEVESIDAVSILRGAAGVMPYGDWKLKGHTFTLNWPTGGQRTVVTASVSIKKQ